MQNTPTGPTLPNSVPAVEIDAPSLNGSIAHKRHATYYYTDGSITILVHNTLFKVHRMFLERDSPKLKGRFAAITDGEGSSDTCPLVLVEMTGEVFADLLWMFYNDQYNFEWGVIDATRWLNILEAASQLDMQRIRKIAVEALSHHTLEPFKKLEICLKYTLEMKWALDAFTFIASRNEQLTLSEGQRLGIHYVLIIGEAREQIAKKKTQQNRNQYCSHCNRNGNPYGDTRSGCYSCGRPFVTAAEEYKGLVQAAITKFSLS